MTNIKLRQSGLVWLWIAVLVIVIDRISKVWAVTHLSLYEPVSILPIFDLTLAYNKGAAFSFLHSASGWQNWVLGGLAFAVSAGIIVWLAQNRSALFIKNASLCLILGGALGNAWDRIQYHYVIDFLSFHYNTWHFAIFNIADSAVCLGAFLMIIAWYKES